MILHNTSLERRDACRKAKQEGFLPAAPGIDAGENVRLVLLPSRTCHSDSPSLFHNPAPFLFFSTRREAKLRELKGGEGDPKVWLKCLLHGEKQR